MVIHHCHFCHQSSAWMTLTLTFSSFCKRLTWKICILCTYMHFLQPTHQKTLGNTFIIINCLHSVSNKNQENIIINRISQIWGLLPCQTNIINTSVSSSPLARDLVESQLLADCELIFYSSEFSLWAALLLIKPPLVLLQSDLSPRHCHLNSHSNCCLNLQSLCHHHHHHHWICH